MSNEFRIKKGLIVNETDFYVSGSKAGFGTITPSSPLEVYGSGSTVFSVNGASGQLFGVSDDLTDSLFSVNTISGLPVIEAFADNTVKIGTFGNEELIVSESQVSILSASIYGPAYLEGNVGIGTTSPSEKLEVEGNILVGDNHFIGNQTTFDNFLLQSSTDESVVLSSAKDIYLSTSGTGPGAVGDTRLFVSSSGNVGIGTSSPGNTLHVFKNATTGPITSTTVANAGLRIQDSGANMYIDGNSIVTDQAGYLTTTGANSFVIGTNNIARIHVDSSGKVGIGTTSPVAPLHISSDSGVNGLIKLESSDIEANIFFEDNGTTDTVNIGCSNDDLKLRTDAGNITFFTDSAGTATERMRIDSAGNVGIGTTSPAQTLDIENAIELYKYGSDSAVIESKGSMYFNIDRDNSYNGNKFFFGHNGASGSASNLVTIEDTGNVGIGTTSPSKELTVQGEISSSGGIYSEGAVQADTFRGDQYPSNSFLKFNDDQSFAANMTTLGAIGAMNFIIDTNDNDNTRFTWWHGSTDVDSATQLMDLDENGNLTVTGIITAQEFHTEFVSASIIYQSGSTKFGDTIDDVHSFTGSVDILTDTSAGNRSFIISGIGGPRLQRRGDTSGWAFEYGFNTNDGTDLGGFGGYGSNTGITYYYIGASRNDASMVVLDTGNVGIGTDTPSQTLTVAGNISGSGNLNIDGTATVDGVLNVNSYIYIDRADERMIVMEDSGGSNTGYLTMNDSQGNMQLMLGVDGEGHHVQTNDGAAKLLYTAHSQDGVLSLNAAKEGTGGADVSFSIGLSVDSSDNTVKVGASSNNVGLDLGEGNTVFDASGNLYTENIYARNANGLNILDDSGTLGLFVEDGGNVGIGTTSPGAKLEVAGDSKFQDLLTVVDDIYPETNYVSNIGAINKKFLTLNVAELIVETLVASERRSTVGGRFNVGISTQLSQSISPASSSILVENNNLNPGDIIHLEGGTPAGTPQVEFMRVTSTASSGSGDGFLYTVDRNLDGTGANTWEAGSGVFNTGVTGSAGQSGTGFIDQYAINSLTTGVTTAGPTIAFMERTGSAYPDIDSRAVVGNLKGWYGYGTDIFGFASGDYKAQNITVDPFNGLRIRNVGDIQLQASSSFLSIGDDFLYDSSIGKLFVSGSNIDLVSPSFFLGGTTQYISGSGGSIEISGSNFHLLNGNITASNVDLSGNINAQTGTIGGFTISADALSSSNFFLSGSATGNEFFISSSNFNVKANGDVTGSQVLFTGGKISGSNVEIDVNTLNLDAGSGAIVIDSTNEIITVGNGAIRLDNSFGTEASGLEAANSSVIRVSADGTGGGISNYMSMFFSNTSNWGMEVYGSGNTIFFAGEDGGTIKGILAGFDFYGDRIVDNATADTLVLRSNGDITGSQVLFTGGKISGSAIEFDVTDFTAKGDTVEISGSNFHLLNGNITASNVDLSGNINAETGTIGGFTITGDALSTSDFYLSGSATGNEFFISSSNFNVKANGDVTGSSVLFTGGKIAGWTVNTGTFSSDGVSLSNATNEKGLLVNDGILNRFQAGDFLDVIPTGSTASGGTRTEAVSTGTKLDPNPVSPPSFNLSGASTTPDAGSITIPISSTVSQGDTVNVAQTISYKYLLDSGITSVNQYASVEVRLVSGSSTVKTTTYARTTVYPSSKVVNLSYYYTGSANLSSGDLKVELIYSSSYERPTETDFFQEVFVSPTNITIDQARVNITDTQALFFQGPERYLEWTPENFTIKGGDASFGDIEVNDAIVKGDSIFSGSAIFLGQVTISGSLASHPVISPVASDVDNSGGTVIQDLDFDVFGHVQSVTSYNLDGRYYTETESDSRFVNVTGDTMTGALIVEGSGSTIFDVQGSLGQLFSITDDLTGTLFSVNDISGIPILTVDSDDTVTMGTFGENTLVVTGSRVGVGTESPSRPLTIEGSVSASGDVQIGSSTSGNANAYGRLQVNQSSNTDEEGIGILSSGAGRSMRLYVDETNSYISSGDGGNGVLVLNEGTGNVGIGTTSPSAKLHVSGTLADNREFQVGDNYLVVTGSNGNVGIGTTSPFTLLHVGGGDSSNVPITFGPSTGGNVEFRNTSITGTFTFTNQNGVQEKVRIDASGNVGIGTTSPSTRVEIDGVGNANTVLRITNTGASTSLTQFEDANTTTRPRIGSVGNNLILDTANTERMRIDSSGNVGIGETNPNVKLFIKSTSGNDGIRIETANTDNGFIHFADGDDDNVGRLVYSHSDDSMQFVTNDQERMRIDSSGNVGIGTTSPSSTLHVNGPDTNDHTPTVYLKNNGGNAGEGEVLDVETARGDGASDSYIARFRNSASTKLYIQGDGLIGIGTESPSAELHVVGDAIITGKVTAQEFHTEFVSASIIYQSGSTKFGDTSDDVHAFTGSLQQSGSDSYFLGNVSIGRTTSNHKLHVQNESAADTRLRVEGGEGTNTTAILDLTGRGSGNQYNNTSIRSIGQNANGGIMTFLTDNSAGNEIERMRIDSSGNVGIGTNNPDEIFHINRARSAGSDNFLLELQNPTTVADSRAGILFSTNANTGTGRDGAAIQAANNGVDGKAHITFGSVLNQTYSENIRFESGGNVGIGTTSPLRDLHVKKANSGGQVRMEVFNTSNTSNSHGVVSIYSGGASGGDPFLHWKIDAVQDWSIGIDNSDGDKLKISKNFGPGINDYMTFDTSGNVGIGTTSPSDKLDIFDGNAQMVFGAASSDRSWLQFKHNAVPADGEELGLLDFRGYNDASEDTRYVILTSKAEDVTDGSEDGSLTFQTMANGTATQTLTMRSGNVGIGTTSPGNTLHVYKNATIGDITSTTVANAGLRIQDSSYNMYMDGNSIVIDNTGYLTTNGAYDFVIGTNNTARIHVDSGGDVGIGTTSPTDKFDVFSSSSNQRLIRISHPSSPTQAAGFLGFNSDGTTDNNLVTLGVQYSNTYYNALNIQRSTRNVGIGTISPSTALEVNGTATVTALVETSTRKLKKDITELEEQSSIVDKLQPVSYIWKDTEEEDFGLIAEDVEEIAPHLVQKDQEGKPTGIKYSKLSVLLLDVVQRQSTLIEDLNERITKLENERGS